MVQQVIAGLQPVQPFVGLVVLTATLRSFEHNPPLLKKQSRDVMCSEKSRLEYSTH